MAKKATTPETTEKKATDGITQFASIRKGEFKYYTLIEAQARKGSEDNPYLCYNVVHCSKCSQEMAYATVRTNSNEKLLKSKGMSENKDGIDLYVLSCNEHNNDPENPICKECSEKMPKKAKKETPAPKKEEGPKQFPHPAQTIEWAAGLVRDEGLVKIHNSARPGKLIKKFKDRETAIEVIVEIAKQLGWTYEHFYKLANEMNYGENLQIPAFIPADEYHRIQKAKRIHKDQQVRIDRDKTKAEIAAKKAEEPPKAEPKDTPSSPKKAQEAPKATPAPKKADPKAPAPTQDEKKEESDDNLLAKAMEAIREGIKEDPDGNTSTDHVTKRLRTKTKQTIRICTRLAQNDLITMEDDSDGNGPFYYIRLTKKGEEAGAEDVTGIKITGEPGRRLTYAGYTIHKVLAENPRRPGTLGFESWRKIKDGMTFEEYLAAGGRSNDLKWDLDHGWVELRKGETKLAAESQTPKRRGDKKLFDNCIIYKLIKENPRREGIPGWHSWNAIVDGMTYEDYVKKGGRYQDLHWDWERDRVKLTTKAGVDLKIALSGGDEKLVDPPPSEMQPIEEEVKPEKATKKKAPGKPKDKPKAEAEAPAPAKASKPKKLPKSEKM